MLLAIRLQKAGLSFISASARHCAEGMKLEEIKCATRADADAIDAWVKLEGLGAVIATVATPEELAEWERTAW